MRRYSALQTARSHLPIAFRLLLGFTPHSLPILNPRIGMLCGSSRLTAYVRKPRSDRNDSRTFWLGRVHRTLTSGFKPLVRRRRPVEAGRHLSSPHCRPLGMVRINRRPNLQLERPATVLPPRLPLLELTVLRKAIQCEMRSRTPSSSPYSKFFLS